MIGVGFALQPDAEFLERCEPLLVQVDYLEVAPETTWRRTEAGLEPNGFHARFLELGRRRGLPFVAHGVGFSLGGGGRGSGARRAQWLERMRRDQRQFRYRWWTDHLGFTSVGSVNAALPLPLPMGPEAARRVRASLARMRAVVGRVGVENTAAHFTLGDPLEEPGFLNRVVGRRDHLLLDLHNVYAMALNLGFEPQAYLERLDLARVLELHLAGGSASDPAWLPSGRALRLDGHDGAVPEPVWALLAWVLPRCPNLRGITLERMEGTVGPLDLPLLRQELARLREVLAGH